MTDSAPTQEARRPGPEKESSPTNPTDVIPCGTCGRTNARNRTFCNNCGRSLWEACPNCAGQCVAGETFCGSCGGNLPQMIREQEEAYGATVDEAIGFSRKHEYGRAIARLRLIAKLTDARYEQVAQRAVKLIDELSAQYERGQAHAEVACRKTREYLGRHDYEAAVKVLESVPPPLRDEQTNGLLNEALSARAEVRSLRNEIREAAKENRLFDLSMRIDRLLALTPDDERVKRLAQRLRGRSCQAAKKKISEHRYDEAVNLLDQIPASERSAEVEQFAAHAAELSWLMTDLKLAAVADETLVAIAERLVKQCPDNTEAESLRQRIQCRAREKPKDPRYAAPDWSIPRCPYLGFPVHWLGVPQRFQCSAEALAAFEKAPGHHFVAFGLALQGIGRASVDINLAPREKNGVLQKFSLRRKKVASDAWGLDAGASSLKAVRLHFDEATRQVTIDAAELIEHKKNLLHVRDDAEKRAVLKETLGQFLERNRINGERICLSISGRQVLGRVIDLPCVDDKKMHQLIHIEAQHRVPVPLPELALGYQVLETYEDEKTGHPQMRVALQAVKRFHAEQSLAIASEAGLCVDVLQSDCVALHNFVTYESLGKADEPDGKDPSGKNREEAIALLDVGSQASSLVISSPTLVWFRSIGVGGDAFTSDLLQPFRLTWGQAEKLKRKPAMARRLSPLYREIEPTLSQLVEEVQRSIHSYSKLYPNMTIQRMFGVGGGFALHGLTRRLRNGR